MATPSATAQIGPMKTQTIQSTAMSTALARQVEKMFKKDHRGKMSNLGKIKSSGDSKDAKMENKHQVHALIKMVPQIRTIQGAQSATSSSSPLFGDHLLVRHQSINPVTLERDEGDDEAYLQSFESVMAVLPDLSLVKTVFDLERLRNFIRLMMSEHAMDPWPNVRVQGEYGLAIEDLETEYKDRADEYARRGLDLAAKDKRPQIAKISSSVGAGNVVEGLQLGVSEQGRYVCKLYDSFGALAAIHDAEKWDALLASGNTVGVLLRPPKRDVKMFPFWLAKVVCRGYDKEKEESVKEQ